jgi:hypothetical protein
MFEVCFYKNDFRKQINNVSNIIHDDSIRITNGLAKENSSGTINKSNKRTYFIGYNDNLTSKKTKDQGLTLFSVEKELYMSKNGFYDNNVDVISESILSFNSEILDIKVRHDFKKLIFFLAF